MSYKMAKSVFWGIDSSLLSRSSELWPGKKKMVRFFETFCRLLFSLPGVKVQGLRELRDVVLMWCILVTVLSYPYHFGISLQTC